MTALLLLLALAGAPKPVDTVIISTGLRCCAPIGDSLNSLFPYYETKDTVITYHSLSQLPKDTTKRWDVKVAWKWDYYGTGFFKLTEYDSVRNSFKSNEVMEWRFVPDSSIVEVRP